MVIVGVGNTACDAAVDLSSVCSQVITSHKYEVTLLGRIFHRVDIVKPVSNVRPSVRPYVLSSVHKKFIRF